MLLTSIAAEVLFGRVGLSLPWIDPTADIIRLGAILQVITIAAGCVILFTGLDEYESNTESKWRWARLAWVMAVATVICLPAAASMASQDALSALCTRLVFFAVAVIAASIGGVLLGSSIPVVWTLFGMLTFGSTVLPVWTGRFIFESTGNLVWFTISFCGFAAAAAIYALLYPGIRSRLRV